MTTLAAAPPPAPTAPRWARVTQAAEYSGIPARTLRRWIRTGVLPATRVGPRTIEVDLNEVDKLRRPVDYQRKEHQA